ncbi:MAG: DJ-1/PfpI/YhbO family deglycase/protease [Candidatus Bathyarchaeia archaeon]
MCAKVLVFVDNGFEDIELLYPYYRLQEAGYEVDVVGHKSGEVYEGKHGIQVESDYSPDEVDLTLFKGIVIPGGNAPDRMRTRPKLVKLVNEADEMGLVIASICHGPQLLIEADVLEGKNLTCYKSVRTDVKNAGGKVHDEPVVVDGRLVTSRFPADLPHWMKETVKLLEEQ